MYDSGSDRDLDLDRQRIGSDGNRLQGGIAIAMMSLLLADENDDDYYRTYVSKQRNTIRSTTAFAHTQLARAHASQFPSLPPAANHSLDPVSVDPTALHDPTQSPQTSYNSQQHAQLQD